MPTKTQLQEQAATLGVEFSDSDTKVELVAKIAELETTETTGEPDPGGEPELKNRGV